MLKSFERPLDYLTKAIKNGNLEQGMPTFQQVLGEEQIAGLSKYIKNFDYEANHLAATKTDRSYEIEVVVDDLEIPWGMEFLLNGDMLITEKEGTLSRFSKANGLQEIKGLLAVRNSGQGGLLDVKAHPNYEENGWVYLSYSYVDENNSGRGKAAIIRAKIESNTLTGIDEINIIQKGTNYGWPVISYGINYRGTTFTRYHRERRNGAAYSLLCSLHCPMRNGFPHERCLPSVEKRSHFYSSHSERKLFTGFATAAFSDCQLIVPKAITRAIKPETANT